MDDLYFLPDELHQRTNVDFTRKVLLAISHHSFPHFLYVRVVVAMVLLYGLINPAHGGYFVLLAINDLLVFWK